MHTSQGNGPEARRWQSRSLSQGTLPQWVHKNKEKQNQVNSNLSPKQNTVIKKMKSATKDENIIGDILKLVSSQGGESAN